MFTRFQRIASRAITGLAATAAVFISTSAFAELPDSYTFKTVDVPFGVPGEDFNMQIVWMNNSGVVSAQYQSPVGGEWFDNFHTAVLRKGEWTVVDVPDALGTGGTNPNNHGQVVLSYYFGDGIWHAAYHSRRGLTPFPEIPGYPGGTIVQGVNDRGQIAASVIDVDGGNHAFFGDGEVYAILDYPDPEVVFTQGNMINNCGVGVGTYVSADGWHAFKWENGEISNIDPPTSQGTEPSATAINNAGLIVGIWYNPDGVVTGYLQDGEEVKEFAVPDTAETWPYFINDRGQVSGIYVDADGVTHGFIATPRRGNRKD